MPDPELRDILTEAIAESTNRAVGRPQAIKAATDAILALPQIRRAFAALDLIAQTDESMYRLARWAGITTAEATNVIDALACILDRECPDA